MEQMKIENLKTENRSCVFTGHRDLGLDFSAKKLKKAVIEEIENGVDTFYNGMAMGFDLIAAETVLSLKKKYPQVKLILCCPCYGQEKYFSEKDKKRYSKIWKKGDEKIVLADSYYRGCMQVRDQYMVERADCMIAYCKKETGGTAYTVKCFKRMKKDGKIIFL